MPPPPPATPRPPKPPRPLSFHLAVGAAALCLLAVGFILVRALTTAPATSRTDAEGAFASGTDSTLLGQDSGARGLQIQVMDRTDPNRLSAEFRSETITPLQAQRYEVTQPRATFYLDDGRIAHIRADGGTMVMPDRTQTPETGTLREHVVVRLFNVPHGGGSPDPDRDEPAMVWTGKSLTFDTTLGEVSTTEPFVLTSPGYEFSAQDAKLLINQALQRLELLTVRRGGRLVAYAIEDAPDPEPEPETQPATEPEPDDPSANPDTDGPDAVLSPPPPPIETLYQAVMRDEVRLDRAGQFIASDRLDMFARTIDNALPEGAITSVDFKPPEHTEEPQPPTDPESPDDENAADQPPATDSPSRSNTSDPSGTPPANADQPELPTADAVLSWAGVLEIRPLASPPAELDTNDLVARFTAERTGVVTFADQPSEAHGQAATVEYGFTTQDLILSGPSQESSVFLTSPAIGEATMGRLELNLGTGSGVVPGPFSVVAGDGVSRLDARERTTLLFAARDGRVTGELREAICEGSVVASDADSSLKANFLHAYFDVGETGGSNLRRLIARDSVRLDDGQGNGGTCDTLDVAFALNTDEPTPTSFDAQGRAGFRDRTAKIDAEHLYATLRTPENGSLEVVKAWADGEVRFRRYTDQIDIQGERLFADLDAELLEVEHEGGMARVARGATIIDGESVTLHGLEGTAIVTGPGRFDHRAGKGNTASRVTAHWTEGMAFDDASGLLEAAGEVNAVNRPDPWTRETITAAQLRVQLEPAAEATEPLAVDEDSDSPLDSLGNEDRAIRTVYAASDAFLGLGDGLATIESARFTAPLPEPREPSEAVEGEPTEAQSEPPLERAFRLSGVEILSDNQAGTLDVPGRGRLFLADLRVEEADTPDSGDTPEDAAPASGNDNQRGAALFDWVGSFHADRALGTAEMLDSVQMSHFNANDGSKAVLESNRLRINFAPGESDNPEDLFGGLRSAIAQENVYLRSDTRELSADIIEYDPDAGIARALAEGFGVVRILDRLTGSPTTASAIVWNLTTDRVDVVDPSTIVIPR
ncbi:MAG: hypothetical protein Q9O74_09125 [Planctomycetota bacterium]|nr:hypothetical protein [Planctomycetota bacterium]